MPTIVPTNEARRLTDDLCSKTAAKSRVSPNRADHLREYILGHLPAGIDVEVVITTGVQTAAVVPADVDAVISSDATDLKRAQAEQLLAGLTADYLVLITGNQTDLGRVSSHCSGSVCVAPKDVSPAGTHPACFP